MKEYLSAENRLDILRTADSSRKWNSPDDQRFCILCKKAITGRQIDITLDENGGYELHCPTEECPSTIRDWFYYIGSYSGEEELSDKQKLILKAWRRSAATKSAA
jgi:hypothetical protein